MTNPAWVTIPSISVPKLLLKYLGLERTTRIFGIPGATFVDLLNELKDQRDTFTYVITKQETGAGYMADGYHRTSGQLAVVLVTSGPGATNALTGAMNAQAGYTPMLVITGEQAQGTFGRGSEQEGVDLTFDVVEAYKSVLPWSVMITTPSDFDLLLRQGLRTARGTPGQATHISIPHDVMAGTMTNVQFPSSTRAYRTTTSWADPADVTAVLGALTAARRPMILLGNGARDALQGNGLRQFVDLVERLAIPVGSTSDGKGLFPESHPLALRSCGYPPCQWPALYFAPPAGAPDAAPYDCLVVLGSSLGNFATNLWSTQMVPAGPFIQVDADPRVLGRAMPTTMGVVADLSAFIPALCAAGANTLPDQPAADQRLAYLRWLKANHSAYANPGARDSDAVPIRPERAMKIVSEVLPPGSHIFPDAGNSCGWTAHYLDIDPPTQIHPALDVGAMGYATAAVVGAKIGAPDAVCLSIGGDGGFLMHGNEIATAKQYGAGAIWMVWDENDLNMVAQGMNVYFPDPVWKDYYQLGKPDLVKFAEGLGADAVRVSSPDELRAALLRAIAGGQQGRPQVIVVAQDVNAMPPFYPGH